MPAISGIEMIPSWSYETQQCNESYLLPLCKKNTCATVGDQTFRSYMNSLIPRKDIASATKRKPVQRYALTHQLLGEERHQARDSRSKSANGQSTILAVSLSAYVMESVHIQYKHARATPSSRERST